MNVQLLANVIPLELKPVLIWIMNSSALVATVSLVNSVKPTWTTVLQILV